MGNWKELTELTDTQVYNACLSMRHNYGSMTRDQQNSLEFQCREWARAIWHSLQDQSND